MKQQHKKRGFSLIELTMALMIIGFVTGAIWIAVQHVWDNYRIYRANQQIMKTVQNIREYYGTAIQTWQVGWLNTDITPQLEALLPNTDIFPAEMRRSPSQTPGSAGDVIDHAINNNHAGGSFHVLAVTNVVSGRLDAFRLQLQGLSTSACVNLLMSAPLTSDSIGYVRVGTDHGAAGNPAAITKGVSATAGVTPMTLATATSWCTGATEADFDFVLHN